MIKIIVLSLGLCNAIATIAMLQEASQYEAVYKIRLMSAAPKTDKQSPIKSKPDRTCTSLLLDFLAHGFPGASRKAPRGLEG